MHVKQNSNCYTYVVKVVLFNGNNIQIARCHHHTGNKYGGQKSGSSFSLACVACISASHVMDVEGRSWINAVRIYYKSIFHGGD